MSDGITCYALKRAGYRVGVAKDVFVTHLGDRDVVAHPEYLARKQAATAFGIVYPDYPESRNIARPPTLAEVALAAPLLAALDAHGVEQADAVELSRRAWPPVAAVAPEIDSAVPTRGQTAATWRFDGDPPLAVGGARAVLLATPSRDAELLAEAQARAAEVVVVLTQDPAPAVAEGWRIVDERSGVHPILQRLARVASRRRWRKVLGYATAEHREAWRAVMESACFGDDALRVYVLRRDPARPLTPMRWQPDSGAQAGKPPRWRAPLQRSNRLAAFVTKATRLGRAEWHLRRSRGRLR